MTLLSNRNSSGHHVSDIAFHIGVDRVLRRAPHTLHTLTEFFPIARLAQQIVAISEPTWFRGGPTQCVGFDSLAMDDRAVASYDDLQVIV